MLCKKSLEVVLGALEKPVLLAIPVAVNGTAAAPPARAREHVPYERLNPDILSKNFSFFT